MQVRRGCSIRCKQHGWPCVRGVCPILHHHTSILQRLPLPIVLPLQRPAPHVSGFPLPQPHLGEVVHAAPLLTSATAEHTTTTTPQQRPAPQLSGFPRPQPHLGEVVHSPPLFEVVAPLALISRSAGVAASICEKTTIQCAADIALSCASPNPTKAQESSTKWPKFS